MMIPDCLIPNTANSLSGEKILCIWCVLQAQVDGQFDVVITRSSH